MLATERYIEFSELNFSTFSVELLKLYQAVCSEIDVVGKMLAKEVNPGFNPDDNKNSILKWWFEIQEWYSESGRKKAVFRQKYILEPWKNFKVEYLPNAKGNYYYRVIQEKDYKVPAWWSDYNSVKHQRAFVDKNTKSQNYVGPAEKSDSCYIRFFM